MPSPLLRFRRLGYRRRRRGRVLGEPLAEEGQGEPVHVSVGRRDAFALGRGQREAEEARLGLHLAFLQLVDFILDDLEDVGRDRVFELAGTRRPLAHDVDEGFREDDLGAREVAKFEVAGRVFGDLFPEPPLELEQMVIDTGTNDVQGVVHVGESEEAFALDVGFGDINRVESGGVIVEDAEQVVVIANDVAVRGMRVGFGDVRRGLHGGEIGHGAKEPGGRRRRLMWDGRRLVGVSAEECRWRSLLN